MSAVAPVRVELHIDLKELLAKSPTARSEFLEGFYFRVIQEYVSSVLSADVHNANTMRRLRKVIASLNEHRVHTDFSLTIDQDESLASQLSQQCPPLVRGFAGKIDSKSHSDPDSEPDALCSALTAGRSQYPVDWSGLLPVLHADRLQDEAPLLQALFERGEWLNASGHLFVVPFLVGSAQDVCSVDADVRKFCLHLLPGGMLVMGCVARDLLQLHADHSAHMATQCIRLVCEWGAVWEALSPDYPSGNTLRRMAFNTTRPAYRYRQE